MADGGDAPALRYSAFISYSHRDAAFARVLHRRLETYRLPRNLRRPDGLPAGFGGAFARRLRPIFRDRDELPAAADLSEAVREAIVQSRALIVVCSPAAAASVWVAREVESFRVLRSDGAVLAALIDGDETTAFPAGLCGGDLGQPLAADFRKQGDGERLALLKLVAVLAGVRLDALVQRDAARRVRQVTVAAAAALVGLAVMTALTWVAVDARSAAEAERNRGETLIGFMLTDLRGKLKGVGRLDLLDAVNKGALEYFQGQDLSRLSETALERRAALLHAIGEDNITRGRFSEARHQFEEAGRTTGTLLDEHPNDKDIVFIHSQSEYWLGFIDWRTSRHSEAEQALKKYLRLTRTLAEEYPRDPEFLVEFGNANNTMGTYILRRFLNFSVAAFYFRSSLDQYNATLKLDHSNLDAKAGIVDTYGWLGDTARLQSHCDAAGKARAAQLELLKQAMRLDPHDAELRSDEASNTLALARIELCRRSLGTALDLLLKGLAQAKVLLESDGENTDYQRQVRAFQLFRARTWLTMPTTMQPGHRQIADMIGDCFADQAKPENDEIAGLCFILHARLAAQDAKFAGTSGYQSYRLPKSLFDDRITSRWGLDLYEEVSYLPQQTREEMLYEAHH